MNNLFLPEVDLDEVPDFNITKSSFWSLKNPNTESYRFISNIFNDAECKEIIKIGKSFSINESQTFGAKGFNNIRKSKNSWLPPCELTLWIYERLQNAIFEVNKHYEYDLHSIENLQFTEYDKEYSGYYDMHVDKFNNETTPGSHRKLSFSVQLTDSESYVGGDLILYSDDKNGITASKQKGSINFFPSFVLHQVTPVTEGRRYSLVSWVSGPKFK